MPATTIRRPAPTRPTRSRSRSTSRPIAPARRPCCKLDPQFAGTALVMVVDDRIIDMHAVEVPAEGTSVALPVTDDWGPGAYVTAILYRPAERRRKADAGACARSRLCRCRSGRPEARRRDRCARRDPAAAGRHDVQVKLANVKAGDTAYVAVAAVDLGILNLTKLPDARSRWLVLRPAPARHRVPRPLWPADRSDAGSPRRPARRR